MGDGSREAEDGTSGFDEHPSRDRSPSDENDESALANGGTADATSDDEETRSSLTEGSLARPLFRLAWPVIVIQLLQVTFNVVDTLYLGRFSAEAVGALSIASPLIYLLIALGAGFTDAGATLVAQYTGAEGDRSAGMVTGQSLLFIELLAVAIGITGYFYTRPALDLLPSDPETAATVIPLAATYMETIFLGMPLLFGFFVFSAQMRGYGNTKTPMRVMFVCAAVNVILDPFFIFGFESNPLFGWLGIEAVESSLYVSTGFTGWGIEGAAYATIFARATSTVLGFWVLFVTSVGPDVRRSHLAPNLEFIEELVRLGVPSAVEKASNSMATITLTAMVATFSPPVVAAYGLGNRLMSLVFLPVTGLGQATHAIVGQNLGAEQTGRAERSVWFASATGAGVMLFVAVLAAVFTEPIVGVFLGDVPGAAAAVESGVEYVRIRSVEFAFIGVSQVILGAFRGAGNTKTAMAISILTLWVGRVASVYYLVFVAGMGETGIWIGMAVGNVLGATISVTWFLRGTWENRYIDSSTSEKTT